MTITQQIAKHLRDVHLGGNWTCSNMKEQLADVTWKQATRQVGSFNTIATLVNHTSYYIPAQVQVLKGGPLEAKDELSFAHPPIQSEEDWQRIQGEIWLNVEKLANLIEQLPETILNEPFVDEKYGTYYRNLQGMIEHTHYHLGQIAQIKKLIIGGV